jgi:hypothetical protein
MPYTEKDPRSGKLRLTHESKRELRKMGIDPSRFTHGESLRALIKERQITAHLDSLREREAVVESELQEVKQVLELLETVNELSRL